MRQGHGEDSPQMTQMGADLRKYYLRKSVESADKQLQGHQASVDFTCEWRLV